MSSRGEVVTAGERLAGARAHPRTRAAGRGARRGPAHQGVDVLLGLHATAARRDGSDYVLGDSRELRGDRLLVAAGRRPRVTGLGQWRARA